MTPRRDASARRGCGLLAHTAIGARWCTVETGTDSPARMRYGGRGRGETDAAQCRDKYERKLGAPLELVGRRRPQPQARLLHSG